VLTLLVESTLTDGNNDTFVQGFLGLLGDEDTRGSLLETREIMRGDCSNVIYIYKSSYLLGLDTLNQNTVKKGNNVLKFLGSRL
jgi:hypothetical protein